jgi:CubicO group peptidase (beta-lactamase class C family)
MEPGAYYCLGWRYLENRPYPSITHDGGATTGFNSRVGFVPNAKLVIMILTNTAPAKIVSNLSNKFPSMYFKDQCPEFIALASANGTEAGSPEWPLPLSPPLSLDSYEGNYTNDIYGTLNIKTENGSLVTAIGPKESLIEFYHWNRDTFIIDMPDIPEATGELASFQIGLMERL